MARTPPVLPLISVLTLSMVIFGTFTLGLQPGSSALPERPAGVGEVVEPPPDTDSDGIPDLDEIDLGLDPGYPIDGYLDSDNDSIPNRDEFLGPDGLYGTGDETDMLVPEGSGTGLIFLNTPDDLSDTAVDDTETNLLKGNFNFALLVFALIVLLLITDAVIVIHIGEDNWRKVVEKHPGDIKMRTNVPAVGASSSPAPRQGPIPAPEPRSDPAVKPGPAPSWGPTPVPALEPRPFPAPGQRPAPALVPTTTMVRLASGPTSTSAPHPPGSIQTPGQYGYPPKARQLVPAPLEDN